LPPRILAEVFRKAVKNAYFFGRILSL